ncbi:hypothetical protein AAL05_22915 [Salmonella enterica subsp. enterica serovar Typhimurium]|nr:hypothetical protein [Salmonella enterica]EED5034079.1 hypothetical protein [Salmonella enterica subsp. enterica serovar Typhimurium]EFH8082625.1 hypothetical protein [Escherichia coli]EKO3062176.1 hypothetical protein [Salmonella enterica subsp. enterica serovar Derby]EBH5755958.1 hypothetical protein [Salmonella enterica]
MGRVKRLPRHLQGKAALPLLGGCFPKGHRLALLAVMPIIEARPGERHEGEAAKLALFQQLLLDGGQPPAFALHEPSLHRFGAALRSSRRGLTDAGVDKANELLDQHLFSRALDAIVATKQTD